MAIHLDTSVTGAMYSNDNLTSTMSTPNSPAIANKGVSEGKWYWEVTVNSAVEGRVVIGIGDKDVSKTSYDETIHRRVYYGNTGQSWASTGKTYGSAFGTGNIIGVALDLDNGIIEFYKNGVSQGIAYNDVKTMSSPVFPYATQNLVNNPVTVTFNFSGVFKYNLPTGYQPYAPYNKLLLSSNNKTYALKAMGASYETNMTSNIAPSPLVASASNSYSTDYLPFRAFSGSLANLPNGGNNCWISATDSFTGYIQLDFGSKVAIQGFSLTPRQNEAVNVGVNAMPKDFTLFGSNDGANYSIIKEYINESWITHTQERTFELQTPVKYRYYKLDIKRNNGGTLYIAIGEIKFLKPMVISELPIPSLNNFTMYGTASINNLDKILEVKNYILQDTISENPEGLLTTKIDRKPLSLRFV